MKIHWKPILGAVKETIFIIAVIHIAMLAIYAVWSRDFSYLNMAGIIDLKLFFPQVEYNFTAAVIGAVPVLALIAFLYGRKKT